MPLPARLPAQLLDRPFRVGTARELGVSLRTLRGSRFRQVHRGVYVAADLPNTIELRVAAAKLVLPPDAVFSHRTAALLCRLPVPDDGVVHASIGGGQRPEVAGIRIHTGVVRWTVLDGTRISSPGDMFVELASDLDMVSLVAVGDALVRRRDTTEHELVLAASATRRRSGVTLARRAAALVRPRVDSPMETRLRLLIVLADLPCPEPGLPIHGDPGQWIATVDLQYPAFKIALEYDGDHHRTGKRQWRHDVAARDELRRHGWIVLSITADDLFRHPQRTVWRIADALAERGCPDLPTDLDVA